MKKLFFAIAIFATFFTNVATAQLVPLKQYWNVIRADNFITPTQKGIDDANAAGYTFVRVEGFASPTPGVGLKPFTLMWNETTDNFTTGTPSRIQHAKSVGYKEIRTECYIWENPAAGLIPLKLFWSAKRTDNYTTASPDGERDALAAGYIFAGIEGYIRNLDCTVNFKEAWFTENGQMVNDVRAFTPNNKQSYTLAISGVGADLLRPVGTQLSGYVNGPIFDYAFPLAKVNELCRFDVHFKNSPMTIRTISLENICNGVVKEYPLYQAVNLLSN